MKQDRHPPKTHDYSHEELASICAVTAFECHCYGREDLAEFKRIQAQEHMMWADYERRKK